MDKALARKVRQRAQGLCEYCHFPEALSELRHVIDHIVARQHSGVTSEENLALACGWCNRHKGPNLTGIDPHTRQMTRLFNPRHDTWLEHFKWNDYLVRGKTDIARATIEVLAMNHAQRVALRQFLIKSGKLRNRPND